MGTIADDGRDPATLQISLSAGSRSDPSNAAGDIVEIRSALAEIRDKSIPFQREMDKCRQLSH
jgi:hypothetical protein